MNGREDRGNGAHASGAENPATCCIDSFRCSFRSKLIKK